MSRDDDPDAFARKLDRQTTEDYRAKQEGRRPRDFLHDEPPQWNDGPPKTERNYNGEWKEEDHPLETISAAS
jgi:hypothetical protein